MKKNILKYTDWNFPSARKAQRDMTAAEQKLWFELKRKQIGATFNRQVAFGPYIFDFISFDANLVIELNGSQHEAEEGQRKDMIHDAYVRQQGLTVLRFPAHEALTNTARVVQTICTHVNQKNMTPYGLTAKEIVYEMLNKK